MLTLKPRMPNPVRARWRRQVFPGRRRRTTPHCSAHEGINAQEMVPCASMSYACAGPFVTKKSLTEPSVVIPGPSVVRSVRLTMSRTAVERESRCVPLPRVALGRLGLSQVGCDPTNRSGEGCALRVRARSMAHEDLRPTWGVATNRHAR
jgi:hypothetical protein